MNSPERLLPAPARSAAPLARRLSQAPAPLPGRSEPPQAGAARPALDRFSVARIYAAFQLRRGDHFPAEVDQPAFDMLVDLFLYDWLNRRVGVRHASGMRLESAGELPPSVLALVEAGLAVATRSAAPDEAVTISLSRAGQAHLDSFFDHMASYIMAI